MAQEQITVAASLEEEGLKVEVLQFDRLHGSKNIASAKNLFFAQQVGIKMKQIKFTLQNSAIKIEPGLLHYMTGDLELESSLGQGEKGLKGIGKSLLRKFATGETMFQTTIRGTGEVYLEPTFAHFLLIPMNNHPLIADRGIFYAGSARLDISAKLQKNISSALFGGEGLFQTRVAGSGICVFSSPVPMSEIKIIDLNQGKLSVDGNFTMLRSECLDFRAEKSAKSLFGSLTSGELLLQTFQGSGRLWLAPTQSVYEQMSAMHWADLSQSAGGSGGASGVHVAPDNIMNMGKAAMGAASSGVGGMGSLAASAMGIGAATMGSSALNLVQGLAGNAMAQHADQDEVVEEIYEDESDEVEYDDSDD